MLKVAIIYTILAFAGLSTANTQQSFMICTPHLKELNRVVPLPFIFQKGNNYCAYIGDNSMQVVADGITWLLNQLTEAFVVQEKIEPKDPLESDNQAFIEYTKETGSSPKDQAGYPSLPSWCKSYNCQSRNGKRHFSAKK